MYEHELLVARLGKTAILGIVDDNYYSFRSVIPNGEEWTLQDEENELAAEQACYCLNAEYQQEKVIRSIEQIAQGDSKARTWLADASLYCRLFDEFANRTLTQYSK